MQLYGQKIAGLKLNASDADSVSASVTQRFFLVSVGGSGLVHFGSEFNTFSKLKPDHLEPEPKGLEVTSVSIV
jgi:hypothetical protein